MASRITADDKLVTFGIGPAGATGPDQRPYLNYGLAPGSVVFDHVAILNQSNVPLTLGVYAGDGLNTQRGGLDIRKRAERNQDFGAWVTLGQAARQGRLDPTSRSTATVTVPAQSPERGRGTVIVPIRIAVPKDASPGDHVGGIAVSMLSRGNNAQSQNIELEQRVVARVYLRVAGAQKPKLSVKILHADYTGGSGLGLSGDVQVTYRITNSGNMRLGANSRVRIRGPFGLNTRTATGPRADELLPGGSAVLTATVKGVRPTILSRADVTVAAFAPAGVPQSKVAPATASARLWAITWQEVAVVALLLLLIGAFLHRRRRPDTKGQPEAARDRPRTPALQP